MLGTLPGETGAGLGPSFNLNSCAGCHVFPAVGGTSPQLDPQVAVAILDGAHNTLPFIASNGPIREARFKTNPDGTPDGGVHDLFVITGRSDVIGPGCTAAIPCPGAHTTERENAPAVPAWHHEAGRGFIRVLGRLISTLLIFATLAIAQGPPGPGGPGGPHSRGGPPPNDRSSPDVLSGAWWTNPMTIRRLGLSDDQQKRLDQIYQQNRLRLIDLRAALEKEEAILEPLLTSEHPPESQVTAQIDRIANARADLEKANARMLFAFRLVLTPDQWKELQRRDPGPGSPLSNSISLTSLRPLIHYIP